MKTTMIRTLTGASLGAMSLALATQASAQAAELPPSEPTAIDTSGINPASRELNISTVDLQIGPSDHKGLSLVRQWATQDWRIASTPVIAGSTTDPRVVIGGRSYAFTKVGSTYVPKLQNGSTLSSDLTKFTGADGTVITFRDVQDLVEHPQALKAASRVVFADGVEHTFTYQNGSYPIIVQGAVTGYFPLDRLVSMNSSTGYQIKLQYQSDNDESLAWRKLAKAVSINNVDEYCDPTANSCNLSGDWPEVTYSGGLARTTAITDPEGRTTGVAYVGTQISAITPPGGVDPVQYTYDGERVETITQGGATSIYSSSMLGSTELTTLTDPNGNAVVTGANAEGLVTYRQVNGDVTRFEYCTGTATCPSGRVNKIIAPELNYTEITYDARGNQTGRIHYPKPNSGLSPIATSATFPATCSNTKICNKPTSTTDAEGHVTNYTWSGTHGGLTKVEAPAPTTGSARPTMEITYDPIRARYLAGPSTWRLSAPIYLIDRTHNCRTAATCIGTADEAFVNMFYANGFSTPNNAELLAVGYGSGDMAIYQKYLVDFTPLGDIASVDGPLSGSGDTSVTFYNKARQQTGAIGPADADYASLAQRVTYDAAGRVSMVESGSVTAQTEAALANLTLTAKSTTEYDSRGRPVKQKSFGTGSQPYAITQTGYDAASRTTCVAQRMNPSTFSSLPSNACTLSSQGAYGPDRITAFTYDAANRRTKVTEAYGTSLAEDTVTMTFTQNGQVATVEDAENNRTTYEYDGHDRNVKVRFPATAKGAGTSSTTNYEAYTFDDTGNVLTFRTRIGETLTMNYDNLGRLTSKIVPERSGLPTGSTRDVYYGYDVAGNLTAARFDSLSSADGLTFTYDAFGRQTSERRNLFGADVTIQSGYDERNLRTSMTYPDGTQVTYEYDVMGRPKTVKLAGVGVAQYKFFQNGLFDRMNRYTDSGAWAMQTSSTFDTNSRRSKIAWNPPGFANDYGAYFQYNPAGQIVERRQGNSSGTYAHPRPADSQFTYTSNGLNQYTTADTANFTYDGNGNLTSDGQTQFRYDPENRLVKRVGGGLSHPLYYDPLGRLARIDSNVAPDLNFIYDGNALIEERNAAGTTILNRYLHGPGGGDDPLVQFAGASTAMADRQYLYADERGSIVAIGGADGYIDQVNSYDAYGVNAPGNMGRFRYTGQIWLEDIDLYHYKARAYSPTLGRFMQTDPIGYGDGMNMYRYVGNDPVNAVDPSGLAGTKECTGTRRRRKLKYDCNDLFVGTGSLTDTTPGFDATLTSTGHIGFASGSSGGKVRPNTSCVIISSTAACGSYTLSNNMKGHNNPPPDFSDLKNLFRRSGVGLIWCILVCAGADVYPQIIQGDLLKDSTPQNDGSGKKRTFVYNGNQTIDQVWNKYLRHADSVSAGSQGQLVAKFGGSVIVRYTATSGPQSISIITLGSKPYVFRFPN